MPATNKDSHLNFEGMRDLNQVSCENLILVLRVFCRIQVTEALVLLDITLGRIARLCFSCMSHPLPSKLAAQDEEYVK